LQLKPDNSMENLKIIYEKENPLFNRKEIQVEINSKIAPQKSEVEDSVAEKFAVPKENIKIKQILGKFGSNDFKITANIYKTKEDKEKTEFKSKKQKQAEAKQVEQERQEAEEQKESEAQPPTKTETPTPQKSEESLTTPNQSASENTAN